MDEEKTEKTGESAGSEEKGRGCDPRVEGDEREKGVEEAC